MIAIVFTAALLGVVPQTEPSPSPSPLQEIGRVRASAPACQILREVTIPALLRAQRSNSRFTRDVAPQLIEEVKARDEGSGLSKTALSAIRGGANTDAQSALVGVAGARRNQAVSLLLDDAKRISDALGDPRIAQDSSDPQIQAQRVALQRLYDYEASRADFLFEGALRDSTAAARKELDSPGPVPTGDPLNGYPKLTGIAIQDVAAMRKWTAQVEVDASTIEQVQSRAIFAIQRMCP